MVFLNDAQFSREKLMSMGSYFKENISHNKQYYNDYYEIIALIMRIFLILRHFVCRVYLPTPFKKFTVSARELPQAHDG